MKLFKILTPGLESLTWQFQGTVQKSTFWRSMPRKFCCRGGLGFEGADCGAEEGRCYFTTSHSLGLHLPSQVTWALELTSLHPQLPPPSLRLSSSSAQINAATSWLEVWPHFSFSSASSLLLIQKSDQDSVWSQILQYLPTVSKALKESEQTRHSYHHWVPFQPHFLMACFPSYSLPTL